MAERATQKRPANRPRRRTGGHQGSEELRRSLSLTQGDHPGAAVFLLEHWRVWLRAVAAVDPQGWPEDGHGRGRLAVGAAVPGSSDRHARSVLGLGQTAKT